MPSHICNFNLKSIFFTISLCSAEALHPEFYSTSAVADWIQVQRLLMRQVLSSDSPVAAAKVRDSAFHLMAVSWVVIVGQDVLADRHYMQRGSGSNIALCEADGLYDAAAACAAVGLLAKLARDEYRL